MAVKTILQRNGLAFPRGLRPGLDKSHPAAKNIKFAAVFSGGTFVNYAGQGNVTTIGGTISGTASTKIDSVIGPARAAGTNFEVTFAGGTNSGLADITMAAIIRPGATEDSGVLNTSGTNADCSGLANFSGRLWFISSNAQDIDSGITLTASTPWFVAISTTLSGNNAANVNLWFIAVNLNNGKVSKATITQTIPSPANSSGYMIGGDWLFGNHYSGLIAAVMHSAVQISPAQLLAWANDPWAFWYPAPTSGVAYDPAWVGTSAAPAVDTLGQSILKIRRNEWQW